MSDRSLKTLVAQVHTSVGQTVEVHPQPGLLEELKKDDEIGIRWKFPDKITFEKIDRYSWQDEYRFAWSITDALDFGNTLLQVEIPAPGTTELPKPSRYLSDPRFLTDL